MIYRRNLIQQLRKQGYKHDEQKKRVHIYRLPGDKSRLFVRRKKLLTDDFVRLTLIRIGMSEEEIQQFISNEENRG